MDFDLPEWRKLADVQWADLPLTLLEKDNAVLMLLAEKRADRTIGYAAAACKPFIVKGDAAMLDLVHFGGEVTLVKKLNAQDSGSFVLAFTKPSYVPASQTALYQAAGLHSKQLQELSYDVKNSLTGGVSLVEPSTEQNHLFADPSLLFSFLSFLRSASKQQGVTSVLGLDLRGETYSTNLASVSLGLVVSGSVQQRLHCLHLLTEEALQQNAVVVIFDNSNSFSGLSRAGSAELGDLKAFSLPGLPAGFPVKEIVPGKNAFVPLSTFEPRLLLSTLGLADVDVAVQLESALSKKEFNGAVFPELNQFTSLKLNRLLKLLGQSFQNIFSHDANIDLGYSFGKALHVNLRDASEEAAAFFTLGLLQQLEKTQRPVFLVFEQDVSEIKSVVELAVNKFLGSNVSILCHSEDEGGVRFAKSADFFVEMLDKDAVVTQGNKPPQRVKLRPTYSACSEN